MHFHLEMGNFTNHESHFTNLRFKDSFYEKNFPVSLCTNDLFEYFDEYQKLLSPGVR